MGTWHLDPKKKEEVALKISKSLRSVPYDDEFFSVIDTEEKAYWLGYLCADGTVSCVPNQKSGGNQYQISVVSKDEDIFKFAHALGYPQNKVVKRDGYFEISLASKRMHDDLVRLGCGHHKTETLAVLPDVPSDLLRHLVRGFFDGDGTIHYTNGHLVFGICGTKKLMEYMREVLHVACATRKNHAITHHPSAGKVWYLEYNGNKQCTRIFGWLYQGATVYMDRKREVWKNFLLMYEKSLLPGMGVSWFDFDKPDVRILRTFDAPSQEVFKVDISTEELTALCPLTGFPDFYNIHVQYIPKLKCIESKSAKFYFQSFRGQGMFIETLTNRIADDWMKACSPKYVKVTCTMKARGGIPITVVAKRWG